MNKHVYNVVTFIAWALISIGAGMIYLPAGLITAGLGLIALLLLTLRLDARHGAD